MKVVRTIVWVVLLVALALFSFFNWTPLKVVVWPNANPANQIVADTFLPVVVVVSFLIGFVPIWLFNRAVKWKLRRRIASLENATRAAAPPVADRSRDLDHDEPHGT